MTNPPSAWIVPVWTKRFGSEGQGAMLVAYASGYTDVNDAVEAVKTYMGFSLDGDRIGESAPLLDTTVAALGLTSGEVRMI